MALDSKLSSRKHAHSCILTGPQDEANSAVWNDEVHDHMRMRFMPAWQ